jgi:hypothetical protein
MGSAASDEVLPFAPSLPSEIKEPSPGRGMFQSVEGASSKGKAEKIPAGGPVKSELRSAKDDTAASHLSERVSNHTVDLHKLVLD